jgi:hypothetical protein
VPVALCAADVSLPARQATQHHKLRAVITPTCRLFWSDDERFLKQFKAGDLRAKFKSYSKFPPCYKDMAFWVSPEFTENNLCELVRGESPCCWATVAMMTFVVLQGSVRWCSLATYCFSHVTHCLRLSLKNIWLLMHATLS